MSLQVCPDHGPYIADTSTDFGETWCPECEEEREDPCTDPEFWTE